ncbi:MAG: UDP-N-acetylmuramoyl-tripeptide--D-alanyl-D-alanine ligase [Saprospiraceae bacterium]
MDIQDLYIEFCKSDGIAIDSRKLKHNQIFFALRGENVDGNQYAIKAIESGARLVVVSDLNIAKLHNKCVYFPDSLVALQQLAGIRRGLLTIPIIGITGSVGKTTTRELISTILKTTYKTYSTEGNYNNHIGVPLSILSINDDVEIAVIEMGANHIGEIAELCEIARPTHGIITRIGQAHLEGFGSLEGVIIAKSDLFRYIRDHQGIAFVNDSDSILFSISKGFDMTKIFIHQEIEVVQVTANPFIHTNLKVNSQWVELTTRIPGKYNLENIIAAMVIGEFFKISSDAQKKAIESYRPHSNRSQIIYHDSNEFLLDAYNANPLSTTEAIKSFSEYDTSKKKILLLGEMNELGEARLKAHQRIVELISELKSNWEQVILVGPTFNELKYENRFLYFENVALLKSWFQNQSFTDTAFLLKASRSVQLEQLISKINPDSKH